MTMKKRFLGLAMAAMVALPATTAYANTTATIQGDDTQTLDHTVRVSGSVSNKQGSAPAGKIQVELPTAMSFAVDEASNLTGANYTVKNKSNVDVRLSVAEFRQANGTGGITVEESSSFTPESKDRSHVTLTLDGRVDNTITSVDLGGIMNDTSGTEEDILDVAANNTGMITLSGEAGTKEVNGSDSQPDGVDKNGAKGEFSLVFKIKKKA